MMTRSLRTGSLGSFFLACALVACGGGGSSAAANVEVYGDSFTSGTALAVKPVTRIQAALGGRAVVQDYSAPGTSTVSALQGDSRQAFTTLGDNVRANRPAVVAILYGGNDTAAGHVDPQFESRLRLLVGQAQAVGARVVLASLIHIPAFEPTLREIDAVIARVAADTGSVLADVSALPAGGLIDGVHPDQPYSDARAQVLAAAIERLL